jgi:argininosuccinate lyase
MAHLWSGRFAGDPDAELFAFGSSFRFDRRLFEDDVRGSRAWAAALARAGVLSARDAAAIDRGLAEILEKGERDAGFVSPEHGDEDVHAFVERELVARIGDAGRRLHTGRSRNEQVAVDLRLYLKRRIPRLQRGVVDLVSAFLDLGSTLYCTRLTSCRSARARSPGLRTPSTSRRWRHRSASDASRSTASTSAATVTSSHRFCTRHRSAWCT